jgi:hypothetical protein
VLTIITSLGVTSNIFITSDTMYYAGTTVTGTRTMAQNAMASLFKVGTTTWYISGAGVS